VAEPVVVVVPPPLEPAISGAMGEPPGGDDEIPDVGRVSFAYAVHVTVTGVPEFCSVSVVDSTLRSTLLGGGTCPGGMVSGVEKKPLTFIGEGGMSSPSPEEGTDPGIGRSNAMGPTVTDSGSTFPVGFTTSVKDPAMEVSPKARKAETTEAGIVSWVWKPDSEKGSALGLGGDRVPIVVTSLITTLPTGVPGQYSS